MLKKLHQHIEISGSSRKINNCRIRAKSDAEAIERWLEEYIGKSATFRTYKKEAERFLVWCRQVRSTDLAGLDRDDVEAYIEFLKNPSPREHWCGPRRQKRSDTDKAWYPFAGPLGESAIKTAIASINSMMSYLVDARYIEFNPFVLIRRKNRFKQRMDEQVLKLQERILSDEEWQAMLITLEEEPENNSKQALKKARVKFLFAILFFLGLRIDELARASWSDCKKINEKWWFFVNGKGDRLGKIPVNLRLLQAIMNYRHAMKKNPLPQNDESSPVIHSLSDYNKALSARQMSNLIKYIAVKAGDKFESNSISQKKLYKFSPHWLRHLSASKQDLAGMSFTNIRSNLRHQNEQTTRQYVHSFDEQRHSEMEKLKF